MDRVSEREPRADKGVEVVLLAGIEVNRHAQHRIASGGRAHAQAEGMHGLQGINDVQVAGREYLDALDAASAPARDEPKQAAPKHISETDPQAALLTKTGAGRFRYETNYLVDTAHAVILDVEATPARLSQRSLTAKRMLERTRDRLGLTTTSATAPSCARAPAHAARRPAPSARTETGRCRGI